MMKGLKDDHDKNKAAKHPLIYNSGKLRSTLEHLSK